MEDQDDETTPTDWLVANPVPRYARPHKQGQRAAIAWRRQQWVVVGLILLAGWYGLATLPYLADFPPLDWAQMGLAAPAYKLATQGVYGNDLFTGFYRTETTNYEYMPLYPLLVALAFKLLGLGVWSARLVSVACGLTTVLLTFRLGWQLYDPTIGLLAAGLLCGLRLGLDPRTSGIPLLDLARVIRYDILVPVWVLASCSCFHAATVRRSRLGYVAAGALAGLATLSHVYGAFILVVFAIVLYWERGGRVVNSAPLYLIAAGWLLTMVPWVVYILQDLAAYHGQMLRHEARFDLLNPWFYLRNLLREPARYQLWIGPQYRAPVLWPRIGIWLVLIGVPTAHLLLWTRTRRVGQVADRLLLVTLPTLALLLAVLIDLKRYPYLVLVLPFLTLYIAFALVSLWRRVGKARLVVGVVLAAGMLEGGVGVVHSLGVARSTTPYLRLTQAIAQYIPLGARILGSQPFWLGLSGYDMRSINLAFVLSDPNYQIPGALSMAQAIDQIDPDYIVVEDDFISPVYAQDPGHVPKVIAQWEAFGRYIVERCAEVAAIRDDDYGTIDVFRCSAGLSGHHSPVRRF